MEESTSTATPETGSTPAGAEGQTPPNESSQPTTFDETYVKQLRREAAGYRKELGEAQKRIAEFEERDQSEAEKVAARLAESEKRASAAELKALRYEVATRHGIPVDKTHFLIGDTAEEMEERAKELAEMLAEKSKPATGSFDGGARERPEEKPDPTKAHGDFLLRALGRSQ